MTSRPELEQRYRDLVSTELPDAARRGAWVIRLDHCFGRVLLDDAVGACWYDVLGRGRGAAFRNWTTPSSRTRSGRGSGCCARGGRRRPL